MYLFNLYSFELIHNKMFWHCGLILKKGTHDSTQTGNYTAFSAIHSKTVILFRLFIPTQSEHPPRFSINKPRLVIFRINCSEFRCSGSQCIWRKVDERTSNELFWTIWSLSHSLADAVKWTEETAGKACGRANDTCWFVWRHTATRLEFHLARFLPPLPGGFSPG